MYSTNWIYIEYAYKMLIHHTHMYRFEVTNAMSTVYTTLDYEYKHKNKATGQVLVPTKCGEYKWDQKKKYKISTIPIKL